MTFVDIAGLVRGASQGEGLGNQFLAAIRETDAICQVVRAFHDDDVVHVDASGRPGRATSRRSTPSSSWPTSRRSSNRLPRLAREAKGAPRRSSRSRGRLAARAHPQCRRAPSPRRRRRAKSTSTLLRDLHLLTAKPFIYVFNVDEGALGDDGAGDQADRRVAPAQSVVLCAQIEAEVAGLDAADASELLRSYGQEESGLEQLVHVGFATLGLQTFLTAGPKEARAWTIHIGDTAPKAAGVIHTDFERGFIKAEVDQLRGSDGGGLGGSGPHGRPGTDGG